MGGTLWDLRNPVIRGTIYGLYAGGWILILAATFLINHFDLFGMRQVWLYFRGLPYTPLELKTPGLYRYVRHPLYPLHRTLVNINMDGINTWGRTKDVEIIGFGQSTMDDWVKKFAARQGRTAHPEARPELGFFYRADHFEFAKAGVPVVYLRGGRNYVGKPESYARDRIDEYIEQRYHKVTDTVRSDWNLSGAVEDTQLLFMVGYDVAQGSKFPQWITGSEFKRSAKR